MLKNYFKNFGKVTVCVYAYAKEQKKTFFCAFSHMRTLCGETEIRREEVANETTTVSFRAIIGK